MTSRTSSGSENQLKPIETIYNGYRFRSRLEARWAVFFDNLKVKYNYEPEGFDLGSDIWYLPDFWLQHIEMWVEIKPTEPDYDERKKAHLLSARANRAVLLLYGSPGVRFEEIDPDTGYGYYFGLGYRIELFAGNWWEKWEIDGVDLSWLQDYMFGKDGLPEFLKSKFPKEKIPAAGDNIKNIMRLIELDKKYYQRKYGKEHPTYQFGRWTKDVDWKEKNGRIVPGYLSFTLSKNIVNALLAARQARFEFGESG